MKHVVFANKEADARAKGEAVAAKLGGAVSNVVRVAPAREGVMGLDPNEPEAGTYHVTIDLPPPQP